MAPFRGPSWLDVEELVRQQQNKEPQVLAHVGAERGGTVQEVEPLALAQVLVRQKADVVDVRTMPELCDAVGIGAHDLHAVGDDRDDLDCLVRCHAVIIAAD